jgi:hypothetical protein
MGEVEFFGQESTEWRGFNLRVQCSDVSNSLGSEYLTLISLGEEP